MKLLPEDIARYERPPPLELFVHGVRTEKTRERYTRALRRVVCEFLDGVLYGGFEERVAQLVKHGMDDPERTCEMLAGLARSLGERTGLARDDPDHISPASVRTHIRVIRRLLVMNDAVIDWKRIDSACPEPDNAPQPAGWAREEIAAMLRHARGIQDRAIILVLASSGVRAGALSQLSWGDLTPVYRVDGRLTLDPGGGSGEVACAMLEAYRGSPESRTALITPEAFAALRECGYAWSRAMGRRAGHDDPVFLTTSGVPARAPGATIQRRAAQAARMSGLLDGRGADGRSRVPVMDGFRRFYRRTCVDAFSGGPPSTRWIRKALVAGAILPASPDRDRFDAAAPGLAAEYVRAVPDLTIDDADRLRHSNRTMADNIRKMESEKDGMAARMREATENLKREHEVAVALARRESAKEMEHIRGEMAELKKQRNVSAADLLAALRDAPEAGGVPQAVMEVLAAMVGQLGAAHAASIEDLRREHDAHIAELRSYMNGAPRPGKDAPDDGG